MEGFRMGYRKKKRGGESFKKTKKSPFGDLFVFSDEKAFEL
jgi:hypothetical protein